MTGGEAEAFAQSVRVQGFTAWAERLAVGSDEDKPPEDWPWVVQIETNEGTMTYWHPDEWRISLFNPMRTVGENPWA